MVNNGWDSPPTPIPMICHWMLSAPMSCSSPLRSSLQLPCLGHLPCMIRVQSTSTPLTLTHTHAESLWCDMVFSGQRINAACTTVCFPSKPWAMDGPEPWDSPKYYTAVLQLWHWRAHLHAANSHRSATPDTQTTMQILAGSNTTDLNLQVSQHCHIKPTSQLVFLQRS